MKKIYDKPIICVITVTMEKMMAGSYNGEARIEAASTRMYNDEYQSQDIFVIGSQRKGLWSDELCESDGIWNDGLSDSD